MPPASGQSLPPLLHRSNTLAWLLEDQPLGPPTRRPGGVAVAVAGEVFAGGARGWLLRRLRTRRYRLAMGQPQRVREVADATGFALEGDLTVTRDGTVVASGMHGATPAILRIARRASSHGLVSAAAALRLLGGPVDVVPRLLAREDPGDVTATVESRLPGRRPSRLPDRVLRDTAQHLRHAAEVVAAATPGNGTAGQAVMSQFHAVVELAPAVSLDHAKRLAEHAAEALGSTAAGLQHGDLWHHNLLVARDGLTGIVDWDAWDPGGVVGADLVGLLATWDRLRQARSIGEAVAGRVWQHRSSLLTDLGITPDLLDACGVSWWLTSIAGTLRRIPGRATDARWLDSAITRADGASAWLPRPGRR